MKYLCRLQKIPCEYCQKQVLGKNMTKHHQVCPKMLIPCPNKCSSIDEIIHEKMKQHNYQSVSKPLGAWPASMLNLVAMKQK